MDKVSNCAVCKWRKGSDWSIIKCSAIAGFYCTYVYNTAVCKQAFERKESFISFLKRKLRLK